MKKKLNARGILTKIKENKKEIKKLGVKKIGLFGSFAKDKQKKKSDVDILVCFNRINLDNYMNLWLFLERKFGRKVDLVIEKNLIPRLNYVKKEAKYVRL
jgi:predicted nucleotidyltransferase